MPLLLRTPIMSGQPTSISGQTSCHGKKIETKFEKWFEQKNQKQFVKKLFVQTFFEKTISNPNSKSFGNATTSQNTNHVWPTNINERPNLRRNETKQTNKIKYIVKWNEANKQKNILFCSFASFHYDRIFCFVRLLRFISYKIFCFVRLLRFITPIMSGQPTSISGQTSFLPLDIFTSAVAGDQKKCGQPKTF